LEAKWSKVREMTWASLRIWVSLGKEKKKHKKKTPKK
jgi:hypothetical protein